MPHVERNPVRAKALPIRKAQRRPWSSAGTPPRDVNQPPLNPGPVPRGCDRLAWVNQALTEAESAALRESVVRASPFCATLSGDRCRLQKA